MWRKSILPPVEQLLFDVQFSEDIFFLDLRGDLVHSECDLPIWRHKFFISIIFMILDLNLSSPPQLVRGRVWV